MNTLFKRSLGILLLAGIISTAYAQPGDSVVIRVGNGSKVTFLIKDKKDLETLKHYNFQALMDDMVQKLEKRDSTPITKSSTEYLKDTTQLKNDAAKIFTPTEDKDIWDFSSDDDRENRYSKSSHKRSGRRTYHSVNFDIGMNNYLQSGKFPDGNSLYSVKPWGSWYVGINSVLRTRLSRKFFLEWGAGVSWYNFKFENYKTQITKDNNGVIFAPDPRDLDFQKSKLTVTYINISAIPMIDFGDNGKKSTFFDGHHSSSFRIGVGPYAGYRLDSYTKQMWYDNGEKHKDHDHDNFYLNNIRYGLRLQLGFRDTDLFFNYDLNELFIADKGPKLNAFSFGITL